MQGLPLAVEQAYLQYYQYAPRSRPSAHVGQECVRSFPSESIRAQRDRGEGHVADKNALAGSADESKVDGAGGDETGKWRTKLRLD